MKSIKILNYVFVVALGFFAVMFGIDRFGNNNTQQANDATIYSEKFCQEKEFKGFNDFIPLEINIKAGKIESINILENKETPSFLKRVTDAGLVEKFYGLTPKQAMKLDIDAVSGATYSSNAIIKSVKKSMEFVKTTDTSPWTWQLIGIICCAVILCVLSIFKKRFSN